jgi:hypothetical protein
MAGCPMPVSPQACRVSCALGGIRIFDFPQLTLPLRERIRQSALCSNFVPHDGAVAVILRVAAVGRAVSTDVGQQWLAGRCARSDVTGSTQC